MLRKYYKLELIILVQVLSGYPDSLHYYSVVIFPCVCMLLTTSLGYSADVCAIGIVAGATGAFIGTPAEISLIRMTSDGR